MGRLVPLEETLGLSDRAPEKIAMGEVDTRDLHRCIFHILWHHQRTIFISRSFIELPCKFFDFTLMNVVSLLDFCRVLSRHLISKLIPHFPSNILSHPELSPFSFTLEIVRVFVSDQCHFRIKFVQTLLKNSLPILELLLPHLFSALFNSFNLSFSIYLNLFLSFFHSGFVLCHKTFFISEPLSFALCKLVLYAVELVPQIAPHFLHCFFNGSILLALELCLQVIDFLPEFRLQVLPSLA